MSVCMYEYIYIYIFLSRYLNVCLFFRFTQKKICNHFGTFFCSFNSLVVHALDFQSRVPILKTNGKNDSDFHPSKVGKLSISNFWELSGKK